MCQTTAAVSLLRPGRCHRRAGVHRSEPRGWPPRAPVASAARWRPARSNGFAGHVARRRGRRAVFALLARNGGALVRRCLGLPSPRLVGRHKADLRGKAGQRAFHLRGFVCHVVSPFSSNPNEPPLFPRGAEHGEAARRQSRARLEP